MLVVESWVLRPEGVDEVIKAAAILADLKPRLLQEIKKNIETLTVENMKLDELTIPGDLETPKL